MVVVCQVFKQVGGKCNHQGDSLRGPVLRCAEGGRPFPSKVIPQWHGESRGRWEEDTWGIETIGYAPERALRRESAGICAWNG